MIVIRCFFLVLQFGSLKPLCCLCAFLGGDISEAIRRTTFGGRWLRLKITNSDGVVQLDTRFPANFMGAAGMVPGVAGMDLESMLKEVLPKNNEAWPQDGKTRILDVSNNGQRIEVTIDNGK